ncbi:uncharacterized protein FOBCDRAFT_246253 [Fusarium oxysporum Fo47]|uniref:uncharacterized protein n=1 Tax=Fusarium oxysporum Fo47 TaxID=660027 RepID=UPI002869C038|nr:uncharacterized protein FOBCDRAFT_246253 [Fusarium oxysporum Fo47]QKD63036.2 hypothetical protein FOBCDRAFT_246253 [Fusarium oxysporum Fo47]
MTSPHNPTVLIVGAGSMGLVTYFVRPKRAEELKQPQFLYWLDKQELHEFKNYSHFTDPSSILSLSYDYILITIDAKSVQSEEGEELVKIFGQAARNKTTKVIIGSVFLGARDWILEKSGLPDNQVTSAGLGIVAYPGKTANLRVHPSADSDLVKKADVAYVDSMGNGFILEDYIPSISSSFSKLYNACGVSNCVIWSPTQCALNIFPLFAVFIGLELLGWPKIKDIDTESEMLDVCGEAGTQTAQATFESTFVQMFAYLEEKLRPLDFQAFNQFQSRRKGCGAGSHAH